MASRHVLERMGDALDDRERRRLAAKGLSPLRWTCGVCDVVDQMESGRTGEESPSPRTRITFKFCDRWVHDLVSVFPCVHAVVSVENGHKAANHPTQTAGARAARTSRPI